MNYRGGEQVGGEDWDLGMLGMLVFMGVCVCGGGGVVCGTGKGKGEDRTSRILKEREGSWGISPGSFETIAPLRGKSVRPDRYRHRHPPTPPNPHKGGGRIEINISIVYIYIYIPLKFPRVVVSL